MLKGNSKYPTVIAVFKWGQFHSFDFGSIQSCINIYNTHTV